jgi:hypothetical protein
MSDLTVVKPKLKVIETSPIINQDGKTALTKFYTLNGVKYKIRYENSNGTSLGFNDKMCLLCFDGAKWNALEDIRILNIEKAPNYFSHQESRVHKEKFFKLMEKHLVTVYS